MCIQRELIKSSGEVKSFFVGSLLKLKENPFYGDILKANYSGNKTNDFQYETHERKINILQIPCGKCIGCRIDYSRSWADRLTYHSFTTDPSKSWFLTLTYNDDALDKLDMSSDYGVASLCYDDMTRFIKALRNKYRDENIDYYYSGEYGDKSFRCHFHAILFNVPIKDLEFWKLNHMGQPIYSSRFISDLWKNGFVAIEEFSWTNAAYVASYVEKKRDGRLAAEYDACGILPEKCRMSRRPGISYDFYQNHYEDIWKNDGMSVSRSVCSSGKLGIPRYFIKLAEKSTDPYSKELLKDFQDRQLKTANIVNPFKVYNSSFDLSRVGDLLRFQEREILSRKKVKQI